MSKNLFNEMKAKAVNDQTSARISKLFFIRMMTSMPLISDPDYIHLLLGNNTTYVPPTVEDMEKMGYGLIPTEIEEYSKLFRADVSGRIYDAFTKTYSGLDSGVLNDTILDSWFNHDGRSKLFSVNSNNSDDEMTYNVLRVYTLYFKML